MEYLDIIIILIICFIAYKLLNINSPTSFENFNYDNSSLDDNTYLDVLFEKTAKDEEKIKSGKVNLNSIDDPVVKPYFSEVQFHNDYRDVITAFNNIAPSQKQWFNRSDYPVETTTPQVKEVKYLIKSFIKELNKNVKYEVLENENVNAGWDDTMPEKSVKSGWDKQMEQLGLPCNVYNKPAGKSKVKLLKIDQMEKYQTSDQTRYIVYLILQKMNVDDQMVLRVSFVLNNQDVNNERDFFKRKNIEGKKYKPSTADVIIEEIFVVGFMSDFGFGVKSPRKDFYKFDSIENENEMMNQYDIIRELKNKYSQRDFENRGLTTAYDADGKLVYHDLSQLIDTKAQNKLAIQRLVNRGDSKNNYY